MAFVKINRAAKGYKVKPPDVLMLILTVTLTSLPVSGQDSDNKEHSKSNINQSNSKNITPVSENLLETLSNAMAPFFSELNTEVIQKAKVANKAYREGRYTEAIALLQQQVDGQQKLGQKYVEPLSGSNSNVKAQVGDCYFLLKDYDKAESYYSEFLKDLANQSQRDQPTSPHSPSRTKVLSEKATNYLEEFNIIHAQNSADVANVLLNLAIIFDKSGSYSDADELYKAALPGLPDFEYAITRLQSIPRQEPYIPPWFAPSMRPEIEPIYRTNLEKVKEKYGADHAFTATRLDLLAAYCLGTTGCKSAEPLYEQAMKIRLKDVDSNIDLLLMEVNSMHGCFIRENKDCTQLDKTRLQVMTAKSGAESTDTLKALKTLAGDYRRGHQFTEAAKLYEQILHLQEKQHSPFKDLQRTLVHLRSTYVEMGNSDTAEAILKKEIKLASQQFGSTSPEVLRIREVEVAFLERKGLHQQSIHLLNSILSELRKAPGKNDVAISMALERIGGIYLDCRKYALAESALKEALAAEQQAATRSYSLEAYTNRLLARAYTGEKNPTKAEECEKEMARLEKLASLKH